MKKIVYLLFFSTLLFSCRGKKVLVEQETIKIDTVILVSADTVSSKGKIGRDTIIEDSTTGIKTKIKFVGEDYSITTITPNKTIPVKGEKTTNKYINTSVEKVKSRHKRKEKKDLLKVNIKINKDSLKYDQKKNKDSLRSEIKKTKIEKKVGFFEKLKLRVIWVFIGGVLIFLIVFGKRFLRR